VEVKTKLALALNRFLAPIRERRAKYEGNTELLNKIIEEGSVKARIEAQKTLDEVLKAMGIR
jgi:tryptophanyl-tRNA synthetase